MINAVKDVTSALGDLMQATKAASGKNSQHPAMHTLKDAAKVRYQHQEHDITNTKRVNFKHSPHNYLPSIILTMLIIEFLLYINCLKLSQIERLSLKRRFVFALRFCFSDLLRITNAVDRG